MSQLETTGVQEIPKTIEKPIPLMGILSDPTVQKRIDQLAKGFSMPPERIMALIQRESGGNPQVRSSSGSRGLMQLTSSVFQDLGISDTGRGMKYYMDDFRQISPDLLADLGAQSKYAEFVQTIYDIRALSPNDKSQYKVLISKLRTITEVSTALGDPYPNLVIGSMYLESIHDKGETLANLAEKGNGKARTQIRSMLKEASRASLAIINEMLISKGFKKIGSQELKIFIQDTFSDPKKAGNFLALHDYNGDKKPDKNGTEHRIHYALATMISEAQLKVYNKDTALRSL